MVMRQPLTSLPRGLKVESLQQPVVVIALAKFTQGLGHLLQGVEVAHPQELLFEGKRQTNRILDGR